MYPKNIHSSKKLKLTMSYETDLVYDYNNVSMKYFHSNSEIAHSNIDLPVSKPISCISARYVNDVEPISFCPSALSRTDILPDAHRSNIGQISL